MNMRELAENMLEWEETQIKADALALRIQEAVMQLQKTQQVGNVRAVYSLPRKTYNYKEVGSDADQDIFEQYTKTETITSTNWRALVLEGMCIPQEVIPFTESGKASVKIKLTD